MSRKIISFVLGIALFIPPAVVSAQAVAQWQEQVNTLQAQIQALLAQIAQLTGTSGSGVDIKVNGSNGPVTVGDREAVQVAWTASSNVSGCFISGSYVGAETSTNDMQPSSGTRTLMTDLRYDAYYTNKIHITCNIPSENRSVRDEVILNATGSGPKISLLKNAAQVDGGTNLEFTMDIGVTNTGSGDIYVPLTADAITSLPATPEGITFRINDKYGSHLANISDVVQLMNGGVLTSCGRVDCVKIAPGISAVLGLTVVFGPGASSTISYWLSADTLGWSTNTSSEHPQNITPLSNFETPSISLEGQSVTPSVVLTSPANGSTIGRTADMPIGWELRNVPRTMLVIGDVTLQTPTQPTTGSSGGGSFQYTVPPGSSSNSHIWQWGINDTMPGTYTVSLKLQDCLATGCAYNPYFPGVTPTPVFATSKTHTITVSNNPSSAPTCTIRAVPQLVRKGGTTTLHWTSANATYTTLSTSNDKNPANGNLTFKDIAIDTTFILTAYGEGGTSSSCATTVGVVPDWQNPGTTTPAGFSCILDGVEVAHGASHTFYSSTKVPAGKKCETIARKRTCKNGTFSGNAAFKHATCEVTAVQSCVLDGVTVAHGKSRRFYAPPIAPNAKACMSQVRTCKDGTLTGSEVYAHSKCGLTSSSIENGEYVASALLAIQDAITDIESVLVEYFFGWED